MIPKLSDAELASARRTAAEARRQRAALKDKIRRGDLTLSQALDIAVDDPVLSRIRVIDLLMSVNRIGQKKAEAIMERLKIAANRRCRGLGRNQLEALKAEFG